MLSLKSMLFIKMIFLVFQCFKFGQRVNQWVYLMLIAMLPPPKRKNTNRQNISNNIYFLIFNSNSFSLKYSNLIVELSMKMGPNIPQVNWPRS